MARLVSAFERTSLLGDDGAERDSSSAVFRSDLARALNEAIGKRFFLCSQTCVSIFAELCGSRPESSAITRALVDRDRYVGLPVYDLSGQRLDAQYPWWNPCPDNADLLYQVRPHRFGFMPRWASASFHDPTLLESIADVLAGWAAALQRREAYRLAYISNLVVFQRIIACLWAWRFVSSSAASESRTRCELRLLALVEADVSYLFPKLGHSYPNNHLLVDRYAEWFLRQVVPMFCPHEATSPDADVNERWLAELRRQIYPDGSSFEHSLHYHAIASDLVTTYLLLMKRAALPVADWVKDLHGRMTEFQLAFVSPLGPTQAVGDATEDPMFPLDDRDIWTSRNYEPIYRYLHDAPGRSAAATSLGDVCELASWLTGSLSRFVPRSQATTLKRFADGGYYCMGASADLRVIFRTGPHRALGHAGGHCKADLLSILVQVQGYPFVVEAGTFTYRLNSTGDVIGARRYFMGPESHNGVSISGYDPLGALEGDFRQPRLAASVHVLSSQQHGELAWTDARIVGGGPYDDHRRGVIFLGRQFCLVYDIASEELAASTAHYGFQLAPGVAIEDSPDTDGLRLKLLSASIALGYAGNVQAPECLVGNLTPPAGWYSPRYGELVPAPQLRFRLDSPGISAFLFAPNADSVSLLLQDAGERCFSLIAAIDGRTHRFDVFGNQAGSGTDEGLDAYGLRWVRPDGGDTILQSDHAA